MGALQAIETVYKGYRFRSRLEARWAVFFDTLGIRYEYEKEGFELPVPPPPPRNPENPGYATDEEYAVAWAREFDEAPVLRYLPDFWLPEQHAWVEIKASVPTNEEEEMAVRLAILSRHRAYIFFGPLALPAGDGESAYCYEPTDRYIGYDDHHYWHECGACGHLGIVFDGHPERLGCGHGQGGWDTPRLCIAYDTARFARFEFGEAGHPR